MPQNEKGRTSAGTASSYYSDAAKAVSSDVAVATPAG